VRPPRRRRDTLALQFGLFNLIYGTWELVLGIDLRHTTKKAETTLSDQHLTRIGA
jgi:hypothetical protein